MIRNVPPFMYLLGWFGLINPALGAEALLDEPPSLRKLVKVGALPPLAARLPEDPQVAKFERQGKSIGQYGGALRLLLGKQKDTRLATMYGYARLVCYSPDLKLWADLLKEFRVEEGQRFVMTLRRGHKWSDGHPFTSEDFRYYWEDVAQNKELSPGGPARELIVDGELPKVTFSSPTEVIYEWSKPNPEFAAWLAGARPPAIYRPAHYLKQFHERYADTAKLAETVETERRKNWADLHASRDRYYRADNPDRPTLQPWKTVTRPPSDRFVFERNPYYHRVDPKGRQLPYIPRLVFTLGAPGMVAARTGTGESDLQARYLRFDQYTFLKQAEKRNGYKVLLWKEAKPAHKALFPNFFAKDPEWRALMRNVKFRRALSMGVHRREINQVIFYGLAKESAASVTSESPLFRPQYRTAWADWDTKGANLLLDELGLVKRNSAGVRLLPSGKPMKLVIDTAGESTEESDLLELIRDSYEKIGIQVYQRPSQREVFRRRVLSGDAMMVMWSGLGNGRATANSSPADFVPTEKLQYQWSQWGLHYKSRGKKGVAPEDPHAKALLDALKEWNVADSEAAREVAWRKILSVHADQVFVIGTVNETLRPVVVNERLRNIPKVGILHFDPGAFFGVYKPDTFWYAPPRDVSVQSAVN